MKTVLFFILTILFVSNILGQNYFRSYPEEERKKSSLKDIENSPYVVDGVIQRIDCFYGLDSTTIFSKVEVKVLQVLKGNLDIKMLEFIIPGGKIGMDDQILDHNPMALIAENHYVFLLKNCTYSNLEENNNYYQLHSNNQTSFARSRRKNFSMEGWYGFRKLLFKTDSEFETFLNKGLNK